MTEDRQPAPRIATPTRPRTSPGAAPGRGPALALSWTGRGSVLPAGRTVAGARLLLQVPPHLSWYTLDQGKPCHVQAWSEFDPGTGEGAGRFRLFTPHGSLHGEFEALTLPVGPHGGFELNSTLSGGTGVYAGASGEGLSVLTWLAPPTAFPAPYAERGRWRLDPAPHAAVCDR
jgi:hypothetical protein